MVRTLLIAAVFCTMTPLLISLQWVLGKFNLPGWGFICCNYYRLLCALLRIRVRVAGAPVRDRAVLYVSNHVSWVDIVVIGSLAPVAFVAKREVANWPLIGVTAKMQRTVFIDRARKTQTANAVDEILRRLTDGISVVLFAEGTSSDGNRVLPFRSALLGVVKQASAGGGVLIQPMSICYIGQHGIPMGRQHRPLVAWYGDLDFLPHITGFIRRGAVDVVVSCDAPVAAGADRNATTRELEDAVRRITAATLRGRPLPAPVAAPQRAARPAAERLALPNT